MGNCCYTRDADNQPAGAVGIAEPKLGKPMAGALIERQMKDGLRKIESLGKLVQGEFTVSVLTWNVLCDSIADSFDKVPSDQVVWEFRKPLIE